MRSPAIRLALAMVGVAASPAALYAGASLGAQLHTFWPIVALPVALMAASFWLAFRAEGEL